MREIGPFNARIRKRTKTSQRRDFNLMVHRELDKRSVATIVKFVINLTIGMHLDQVNSHVY